MPKNRGLIPAADAPAAGHQTAFGELDSPSLNSYGDQTFEAIALCD